MSVTNKVATRTLVAGFTVIALMVAAAAVPTASSRERATTWARSLSATDRQSYSQSGRLIGLPAEYRKALFATLTSADEKIAFWQGVARTYRQQHTLSPEEDLSLKKGEAMIPVMFRMAPSERVTKEAGLARVTEEIKRVLGPAAERELFQMAGPDGRTDGLPVVERVVLRLRGWSRTNVVALAAASIAPTVFARAPGCNCNASQNDCYYYQTCTGGLNDCTESGGCACTLGIFNCWTCDGQCNYPV
jgi:hypothetical protein